ASLLVRNVSPAEASVGHLRVEGPRDLAFLLPLPHVWDELCVDELAGRLLNELLLVCEPKVHRECLPRSNWTNPLNLRNGPASTGCIRGVRPHQRTSQARQHGNRTICGTTWE